MEGLKFLRNTQIIILGVCIAVATVASSFIISKGLLQIKKFSNEVISVTGSAEKKITSDYIVWNCAFMRRDPSLKAGYAKIQKDLENVKKYLLSKGIKEDEIIVSQISTKNIYKKTKEGKDTNDIENYEFKQGIEVRSYDVNKVDEVSRGSTELINQDIDFVSGSPDYFYTKLADLKIEMLSRATEDAKQRAISMANSTNNKIGAIRSAKMGVFQITPITSTDVSWYGENDTSSLEKKVMAVVSATFSIE